MTFKITDNQDNDFWFLSDNITVIPIKDFNILIDNNINNIMLKLLKDNLVVSQLRLNDNVLNAITDIVIANKSSKEIDHVLVENNVPYFSFVYGIIDIHKRRCKYLNNLTKADEVIISYKEENIKSAIALAKYLNKKVILDNTNISLDKYKKVLEEYSREELDKANITFYYQENNNSITASELYKTSALVSEIANKIKEANLSNIESIMYAYDILKKRLYKPDEENYYKSSDVSSVLTGDSIVCAGYSNVFNAILKCLNIKAAPLISKEAKHQRSIIYVQDEKYNIDGVYVFDPTWDRRKNKEDKEYINRYNYFAIPLSVSNETAKDELYKALTIEPYDYLESRNNLNVEEMRQSNIINDAIAFIDDSLLTIIADEYAYGLTDNIIKIYTNIKAKYDIRHLREEKFLKILYNTRVAEYKDRIIKEVDIENLIEVVIERYQKIQRNKLKKMNLSSWKEELVIAIFASELENNLYEYLKVPKAKIRKRKIEVDN